MSYSTTQFQIQELRAQSQQKVLETIMIGLIALMSAALLPSLLLQYFYDITTLTAEPAALRNIPTVSYVVSAAYFLYALIGNFMRENRIKQLRNELVMPISTSMDDSAISDTELAELEAMVDEVLESSDIKSDQKKKAGRKATRTTKKSK